MTPVVPLPDDAEIGGGIDTSLSAAERNDFRVRLVSCSTAAVEDDDGEETERGEMDGELAAGVEGFSSANKVVL